MGEPPVTLASAIYECYFARPAKQVLSATFLRPWAFACASNVVYLTSTQYTTALLPAWERMDTHRVTQIEQFAQFDVEQALSAAPAGHTRLRCEDPLPEPLATLPELAAFRALRERLPPRADIAWLVICIEFENGANMLTVCDPKTRKIDLVACTSVLKKCEAGVVQRIDDVLKWFCMYLLHQRVTTQNLFCPLDHWFCTPLSMHYLNLRLNQKLPSREVRPKLELEPLKFFLAHFLDAEMLASRTRTARQQRKIALASPPDILATYIIEQCRAAADAGADSLQFTLESVSAAKAEHVLGILLAQHLDTDKLYSTSGELRGLSISWKVKL